MKSRYMISCAVSAILSGWGGLALADDQGAVSGSVAQSGVEDVIVTAEHKNESLEKTPMTLQAFTGEDLDEANVVDLQDLLKYTPNVTYGANGPGQGDIFMRGLSNGFRGDQSTGTVGIYPNVAIYLDEQSMQFPARNVDIYMVDMQRVEVLEGPQGTLYGGGAEAGALRYITNKPDVTQFAANAEGMYGVTSGGDPNTSFNAMVNIPIIQDKLAVRFVIYDDRQGGYINNVYSQFTRNDADPGNTAYAVNGPGISPTGGVCPDGGTNPYQGTLCTLKGAPIANNSSLVGKAQNPVTHQGGRFSALYDINNDWNILIQESVQNLDAEGLSVEYPYSSQLTPAGGLTPLAPLEVTAFSPSYDKDDYANTSWTVNGKIGDFSAIYTGGWMVRHINQQMDYTNYSRTYYGVYYQCSGGNTTFNKGPLTCNSPVASWQDAVKNTHLSQEVRVSTPDDWRIRGIIGGYYEQFRVYDDMNFNYRSIPTCNALLLSEQSGGLPLCLGADEPYPGNPGLGIPPATSNDPYPRGDNTAFGEDTQRGYDQTAFFGSLDFDIIPKVLTATAGTRWFQYNEYEVGSVYTTNPHCEDVLVCDDNSSYLNGTYPKHDINAHNDKATFAGFKSKLGVNWNIDDNNMAYYVFSQGYRPGGFNRYNENAVADGPGAGGSPQYTTPNSYRPDSLTNQEVGIKSELFNNNLQVNVSVYLMHWNNVQWLLFDPQYTGNVTFATNGPSYDIKGAELQFVGRPMEGVTVQGSATYNENTEASAPCLIGNIASNTASFGKCIQTINGSFYPNVYGQSGDQAAFSPKFQGNIKGRYDWTFNNFLGFATLGASYTGGMWNDPANFTSGAGVVVPSTTYLKYYMPGYTTFDASLGISKDKWTAEIFGENLGDSHASTFTSSAQWIKSEVPLRPRVMGLKISLSY